MKHYKLLLNYKMDNIMSSKHIHWAVFFTIVGYVLAFAGFCFGAGFVKLIAD